MNDAHFHLVVNHLPIVGLLIGTLVLVAGLLLKKSEVKLTAFGIFVFSAITSIFAFYTGEGAEEMVENMSGISETLIHTHEEYAESFFTISLILGAFSLVGFVATMNQPLTNGKGYQIGQKLNNRLKSLGIDIPQGLKKFKYSGYLATLILLLALVAGVLAKNAATSGGEIRHSEIRSDAKMILIEKDHDD